MALTQRSFAAGAAFLPLAKNSKTKEPLKTEALFFFA